MQNVLQHNNSNNVQVQFNNQTPKTAKERKKVTKVLKNCATKCWYSIKTGINRSFTTMKIRHQLILFFLLCFVCVLLLSILIHFACYENIFFYDLYTGEKVYLLDKLLDKELRGQILLGTFEISNKFTDKISNAFFLRIYGQELISHYLLSGHSFTDISNFTETLYEDFNTPLLDFLINKEDAKENIDTKQNNDPLYQSEFNKITYYLFPLLCQDSEYMDNKIIGAYHISYEISPANPMEAKFINYFNFPVETKYNLNYDNFSPNNFKIDPYITNSSPSTDMEKGYNEENWFYQKDFSFRQICSKIWNRLSFINLSIFRKDTLSTSIEEISQLYYYTPNETENDGTSVFGIINFVIKYEKETQLDNAIDYSLFAVKNTSILSNSEPTIKFSDNLTYVISQNSIVTIVLSDLLTSYFTLGVKRNNNLFYSTGINFDTFDIEMFSQSEDYFTIQNFFKENLRVYSSMLFYNKFIQNQTLDYLLKAHMISLTEDDTYIISSKNESMIKEICESFNFTQYKKEIDLYKSDSSFNCFSEQQLFYYNKENNLTYRNSSFFQFPNCECIPFYCINLAKSNIDAGDIEYVSQIKLPSKCTLSIDSYYKPDNKNEETSIENGKHYKYLKFHWIPLLYLPEMSLLIVYIIDNEIYKIILEEFSDDVHLFQCHILLIHTCLIGASIIASLIIVTVKLNKFTSIINQYMGKHRAFLFNIEGNENVKEEENERELTGNKEEEYLLLNENEEKVSLENENDNLVNATMKNYKTEHISDNILIDDLFNIFCTYYKLDPYKTILKSEKNQKVNQYSTKVLLMKNKNDLFDILSSLSQNAPKFKFNLTIDLNLYFSSKLNIHYLKGLTKFSNVDKKQVTLTQGILFELISTENVFDYGLVLNLRFGFVDNFTKKGDIIKKVMFQNCIFGDYKLIGKKKDEIFYFFEKNMESDDVFGVGMFESAFNFFLINVYYKYYEQIRMESELYSSK